MMEGGEVPYGGAVIGYEVRRSRRRTVSIAVADGAVVVTAPALASLEQVRQVVRARVRWIFERVREQRARAAPRREFVSGETFLYLGRQHRLLVPESAALAPGVALRGGRLVVAVARAEEARAALVGWYRRRAVERLPERVALLAGRMRVAAPLVLVRDQKKRWGSCDRTGALRLNWRVVQMPWRLLDYVIAHELVHGTHRGHSRAFWAALGRFMGDYEARRQELLELGPYLDW